MILGNPIAHVEKNSITVHRNFRGFYYERTFVKGQFTITGTFQNGKQQKFISALKIELQNEYQIQKILSHFFNKRCQQID